eukprot:1827434-Rhodomonas_salina.2
MSTRVPGVPGYAPSWNQLRQNRPRRGSEMGYHLEVPVRSSGIPFLNMHSSTKFKLSNTAAAWYQEILP